MTPVVSRDYSQSKPQRQLGSLQAHTAGPLQWNTHVAALSPFEIALLYWSGLGAPKERVAIALRTTPAEIESGLNALAAKSIPGPDAYFSGVGGYPSRTPWRERTAAHVVRVALNRRSDEQLVHVAGQGALTVNDVHNSVARIVAGLMASGVSKGERVAVDATQRIESYLIILACLVMGAEIAAMTLAGGILGVRNHLSVAPARITFSELADHLEDDPNSGTRVNLGHTDSGAMTFDAWLSACPAADTLPDFGILPTDIALLNSTSGSTGTPKLIRVSHEAVFRSGEALQSIVNLTPKDIFCSPSDVSATFRHTIMMPLLTGGQLVMPSAEARQQPLVLAQECDHFGVTQLTAVPNVLRGLVKAKARLKHDALHSLKTVISSAAVLDKPTRDAFADAFHAPVLDIFGSRETFATLYSQPGEAETVFSAGGLVCNAAIAIADDDGNIVAPGQIGEIMVHSDSLASSGLSGSRPKWAGWQQSGDLGRINADGTVQIVGRKRDVIKGGDGSMIFPAQIETLLNAMAPVKESCVLGWSGKAGSEHVIACVILKTDADDFEAEARKKILAEAGRFSVPARIIVVEDFKRLALQKIDKARLRADLADTLRDL